MACSSRKITYPNRHDAKAAARVIKSGGKKNRRGIKASRLRPYECPLCGLWHLTSKTRKYMKGVPIREPT